MTLLMALWFVECGGDLKSPNPLQITKAYVRDCNKILDGPVYKYSDVSSRAVSLSMVSVYLDYYGDRYSRITGELPTAEVYARIHNGGPDGWKKDSTKPYWEKVKLIMETHK